MSRHLLSVLVFATSGLVGVALAWSSAGRHRPSVPSMHSHKWEVVLHQADEQCARHAYALSIKAYQSVIDFAPANSPLRDIARQRMQEAIESREEAFETQMNQGDRARAQLDFESAKRHYTQAIELYLHDASSPVANEVRKKLACLIADLSSNKMTDFDTALERAKKEMADKHFQAAKQAAMQAIDLFPFAMSAQLVREEIETSRRQAITQLQIEIRSRLSKMEYARARDAARLGIEYDPDNKEFQSLLAECESGEGMAALAAGEKAFRNNKFTSAVAQWTLAVQRLPGNDQVKEKLAQADRELAVTTADQLLWSGDYARSQATARGGLVKHPRDDRLQRLVEESTAAIEQGEVARFRSGYEQLLELRSTSDGTELVMLDSKGDVRMRNGDTGMLSEIRRSSVRDRVEVAGLSPTGGHRVIVDETGRMQWGHNLRAFPEHAVMVGAEGWLAGSWSGNETRIALVARNGKVVVVDALSSSVVYEYRVPTVNTEARCVAVNADGQLLAVGFSNGTIRLVRSDSSGHANTIPLTRGDQSRAGAVSSLRFSPDSATLASGTSTGIVRCWSVGLRLENADFTRKLHAGAIRDLCFSSNGQWFASSADDASVTVWKLGRKDPVARLERQPRAIHALAFCSHRNELITGDSIGVVKVWTLEGKQ